MNLIFRLLLTFNATSLLLLIYLVQKGVTLSKLFPAIPSFLIWPNIASYLIYFSIPVLLTGLSILLSRLLGSDVFGMIAILGIGARGIDTPAERDFLIKVMTGERKMTPEALRRMTLYRRKYSRMVIEDYNARLKDGYYALYIKHARPLKHIDVKPLEVWQPPAVIDTLDTERIGELGDKYNLN